MGIFIHAVDANTGDILWTNDGDGSSYMRQPHYADAFGGIAAGCWLSTCSRAS